MNRRIFYRRARYMLAVLALFALCACGAATGQVDDVNAPELNEPVITVGAEAEPKSEPGPEPTAEPEPESDAEAELPDEPESGPGWLDAAEVINTELDTLRKLGLLTVDFEVTREDCDRSFVTNGRIDADFTGTISFRNAEYEPELGYTIDYDAGSGKITSLVLKRRAEEGVVTTEKGTYYYSHFDNFEDIVSPELTIGGYCDAWAQYRGCDSYELPEGVDAETKLLDADELDAWRDTGEGAIGLRISFHREGEAEPEYAWICYGSLAYDGSYIGIGDYHFGYPLG